MKSDCRSELSTLADQYCRTLTSAQASTVREFESYVRLNTPLKDFEELWDYPVRTVRILHLFDQANIVTLGDLLSYTANSLLALPGFGPRAVFDVEYFLKQLNLKLETEAA